MKEWDNTIFLLLLAIILTCTVFNLVNNIFAIYSQGPWWFFNKQYIHEFFFCFVFFVLCKWKVMQIQIHTLDIPSKSSSKMRSRLTDVELFAVNGKTNFQCQECASHTLKYMANQSKFRVFFLLHQLLLKVYKTSLHCY